ncbi:MAG: hypothetical protein JNL10_14925 [Verrucomicrobiales bacterium]|nr:hypothetical protein [Verrucomicrobiales bacterium]
MTSLPKLLSRVGNEWVPHQYPKVFVQEKTTGPDRLKIAASEGGSRVLLELASVLQEPFGVLYVLMVPRGGSPKGRHQSPCMNRAEVLALFDRFERFWDEDGRHHVWLYSEPGQATLVYDQHNVVFAYGPLGDFRPVLKDLGYSDAPELSFPSPHAHQYHQEFDEAERTLVSLPGWRCSPLDPGDEW